MKSIFINFLEELKSVNWHTFIKWLVIITILFGYTVLLGKDPILFIIGCVILYYIYNLEKQIDKLNEILQEKDKEWRAVNIEERLKALKKLQDLKQ